MNSLKLALRFLRRDWHSGALGILALALVVAVSSMTAVSFFTDRIARAVEQQAASLLAADLVLRSRRSISDTYEQTAESFDLSVAKITSFPSVVLFDDRTSLAQIKGVTQAYPLRGQLMVSDKPFVQGTPTQKTPGPGQAWADARLMGRLGVSVGEVIDVGRSKFEVSKVLESAPDQGWQFTDFAPTLLVNHDDIPATGLLTEGSRVSHRILFAGTPSKVSGFRTAIEGSLGVSEDLRDIDDAGPEIQNSLKRAQRFLGLAALVSVLLAAVAISMAARSYANRHLTSAALMKAFGARQKFIQDISISQMVMLALITGIIGTVIGYLGQAGLILILGDAIGTDLPQPSVRSGLIGFVIAIFLLAGFALPAFLQLKRVPPARVLRKDLEPIPLHLFWVALVALFAVSLLSYWLVRDVTLLLFFGLGLGITIATLVLAGWLVLKILAGLRGSSGIAWRYGLASVSRRGRESILQVVAFGVGLMVLLLLGVVRGDLLQTWQATLPEDAPNYFLINIQKDDLDKTKTFMTQRSIEEPYFVPLVRARMTAINNTSVNDVEVPEPEGRRFLDREANLSWRKTLQEDNQIVDGLWWQENYPGIEVSVERDFAQSLGLKLDDILTFDIAGETLDATITSLREVEWDSFQPNFFMVFAPNALDDFPHTYITSVHLTAQQKPLLVDLVRELPSVTPIDMENVLNQVRSFMDKAALAVEYVFLFTLLAGLVVLLAAIQASRGERQFESAILRTLGASRSMVFKGIAVEFLTIGGVAGLLAAVGAAVAGFFMAERALELDYVVNIWLWPIGLFGGAVIVGLSGILATRSVLNHPPVETLRKS